MSRSYPRAQTPAPDRPWYRQLWPWLLIVPPLGAVLGGVATLWLAVTSDDGLVSDDYYREGLAINRRLASDVRARELGLIADVRFNFEDGRLQVLFGESLPSEPRLVLHLLHPTRARHDQRIELPRRDEDRYEGGLAPLTAGLWHLRLEPEDGRWRLAGRLRVPGEASSRLLPGGG